MIISKITANRLLIAGDAKLEGTVKENDGSRYAILTNTKDHRTDHSRITRAMEIVLDLRDAGYDDEQIADALCDGEYIKKELAGYKQAEIEDAYAICEI